MKAKLIFYSLGLSLSVCFSYQNVIKAQGGCSLIDKNNPPHYISFERMEEVSSPAKGESRERVILRLRNNTNCQITIRTHEYPDTRTLEMTKLPDGKVKFRIESSNDLPDGSWLEGIEYSIEYLEPQPPPQKRYFQVDDTFYEMPLLAGRSLLFSVPLNRFDQWIQINVPFYYDWDFAPNQHDRNKAWQPPSHEIFFGNMNLPEEIFSRTKVCQKVDWCKPTPSNNRSQPKSSTNKN